MGRPGCRQCCDDETPESCSIPLDRVFSNGNNEIVGMSESEFRELVRHTGDPRPDNPPEDYDDYVISENVIDEIFSGKENLSGIGTYVVDLDEKCDVQRVITSVIKDDNYSFFMDITGYSLSNTVGNVEDDRGRTRTEVKTKTRKLFIRSREIEISGEFVYMLTIEIAGKSFEFPYSNDTLTDSTFFLDLSLSPDIVDINFNSHSFDDGFCFNMMEELGEYLPEDELKEVDYIEILPPDYFRSAITQLIEKGGGTDNASDASVPDELYVTQFLVYNKEGTEKLLFNVFKNSFSEVVAEYRDHRAIGGYAFYTEIEKDFIDQVNLINKETSTREALIPVIKSFYEEYSGWEIIGEEGFPDTATKTIKQSTFIEKAKHHVLAEFFQNDVTVPKYTHVEYIGDVDQKRKRGLRVRETETEVTSSDLSDISDSIFDSSDFLEDMIGEVDVLIALLDTEIQVKDLSMNLTQGDTTATGVFKSDLLVDTYLPTANDYTFEEVGYRQRWDEGEIYIGDKNYGKIYDLDDYRHMYYCSIGFKDIENGAMLNYENTDCSFSSGDYYGSASIEGDFTIGKQICVLPFCGSIESRTNVRLPDVSSHNEEYTIHYEGTDQEIPRAVVDVDVRYDDLDRTCGLLNARQEYRVSNGIEVVGSGVGAGVRGISSSKKLTIDGFRLNSANEGEWVYAKQYKEYISIESSEGVFYTVNILIEPTNESSIDILLKEEANRLISQYSGERFQYGNVAVLNRRELDSSNLSSVFSGELSPIINLYAFRYNLFSEGDSVKIHNYISQWPSKSYETIGMKPNTRGFNVAVGEERVNEQAGDLFETSTYGKDDFFNGVDISAPQTRSFPPDYVPMRTKEFDIIYHKGKDTNYIDNGTQDRFMGDSLHSCTIAAIHSQMAKSTVMERNYSQINFVSEDAFDRDGQEYADLILEWERKIASVRCTPAEKTYYIEAVRKYNDINVGSGNGTTVEEPMVSRDYTYIELLEGVEEEKNPSSIFSPNSGEDSIYKGIKALVYQLSAGEGTTSTDIGECLKNFYNQQNIMVWDSDGYFLDANTGLGGAGQDYNLGSKTLSDRNKWDPFTNNNCETCSANNSLRYTISTNGIDRRTGVVLDGIGYERVRQQLWNEDGIGFPDGSFCVDYTYKTNKLIRGRSLGQRLYYDPNTFSPDFPNTVGNLASSEIRGGWPGEAVVDLEWSTDCLTSIGGFGQKFGLPTFYPVGGETKTKTSGGYYIHADAVQGSDYYYYNYKYKVTSSVKIRAYPVRTSSPLSDGCAFGGGRWNLDVDSNIFYSGFDKDGKFSSNGFCLYRGGSTNVEAFNGWNEYGTWEECDCPTVRESIEESIPGPRDSDGNKCYITYPTSGIVKTWNFIANHDVYIFAEDQSFSTIDIRDFPQKIKENRITEKPTVNHSITLESHGNIKINNLDIDPISFRWGPDEYYEL